MEQNMKTTSAESAQPFYGVTIVRFRLDGFQVGHWADGYIVRKPSWVNPNSEEDWLKLFRDTVEKFLLTEDGQEAWEDTCGDFNWGDVGTYIPEDFLEEFGIYSAYGINGSNLFSDGNAKLGGLVALIVEQDESFDEPSPF